MHKYLPQTLDRPEFSQCYLEVKHMRPCHCFFRDGVPPTCIYNSSKEMIQNKLYQKLKNQKLKNDACYLKQLEPSTPWSNTTERQITDLNLGACFKLL